MSMTETHHLNLTDPAVVGDQPVIITITRDFGAEGHEIGKLLSIDLGIPLYDNELVVRAAQRLGMTEGQVAAYDEKPAGEMVAFLPDSTDPRTTSDKLFHAMEQVILDLGSTQSCIIEGRLADYILRDNPNLLNVLVTAPFDERVRIVRCKRGLSKKKGAKLVRKVQRSREEFYKRYSAGSWHYHDGKHLVVDRAAFGREGCCAIIACAFKQKVAQATRTAATS